jgi:hypothetical protein
MEAVKRFHEKLVVREEILYWNQKAVQQKNDEEHKRHI